MDSWGLVKACPIAKLSVRQVRVGYLEQIRTDEFKRGEGDIRGAVLDPSSELSRSEAIVLFVDSNITLSGLNYIANTAILLLMLGMLGAKTVLARRSRRTPEAICRLRGIGVDALTVGTSRKLVVRSHL